MNEQEAQKIIKQMDAELETFDRAYEEGRWLKNQGLLSPADQADLEGRRAAIFLDPKIQAIIETYINSARDPVFRRLLLVLDRLIKYSRVESNASVYKVRSRIEQAIINYPITIAGKKATRTDARQILRTEKDSKLREAAFHCYDELSRQVQDDLKTLVALRNTIAQEMGYAHFGVLGLGIQGLTWAQLNEWFDDINVLTESMYRAFLAESAEKLHQDRLYPHDLLYAMTAFKTLPDSYFPSNKLIESITWLAKQLNLSEAVAGIRIDFVDIPFQGLCVTIHVPDVIRILINPSNGHSFYATFFHEVGHAMHSAHIRQPYHLFQDEVGPFCEGMADTMARFVDDRDWLIKWAKIPEQVAQEHKTAWRFVEISETRRLMSQVAFEWQMYADPAADNLAAFQATRSEYLKVPSHDTVAWADNSYWSNYPFYAQNYIISEMIASQTHLAFRRQFGHSVLPESSKWLDQNYWSPGGSVEWTDKIAQATGAPLSPKQMILEMTNGYPPE